MLAVVCYSSRHKGGLTGEHKTNEKRDPYHSEENIEKELPVVVGTYAIVYPGAMTVRVSMFRLLKLWH